MSIEKFMKRPLEVAYVWDIMDKIGRTLEKYELIIPEVEEVIRGIVMTNPEDHFNAVVIILQELGRHESESPFIKEMMEGVRQDFWHGIDPDIIKHEGEFYVTSVAD